MLFYRNYERAHACVGARHLYTRIRAKEEWKAWNTSNVFINNFRSNDRATRADVKLIHFCVEVLSRCRWVCVDMGENKVE